MKHTLQLILTIFLLACGILTSADIQAQTISTFAGSGIQGYSGDGGQATIAQLSGPSGVAIDDTGNMYISDEFNNCIRKISTQGIITTIAGIGISGYSGDNGAATAAKLNDPTGVAVDNAGNVYVADNQNNCIREINAGTGIITTIAGTGTAGFSGDNGAATDAELNTPFGVEVGATGNIYISDHNNNRIRKVSSGIITTFAGQGTPGYTGDGGAATASKLSGPEGIALDDSDNIYIADFANNVIRKVTALTGIINTVAGNGSGGYYGDGGKATKAELNYPAGICLDAVGNFYISEHGNNTIRKVHGGVISTIAGDDSRGYSGDGGPATAAQLNNPNGLVSDTAGNIYVADLGNNRIREITGCLSSLVITPIAPTICSGQSITLVASGGSGYTWSPSTGLSATTGDSVIATLTGSVTYTVTSLGSAGCEATGSDLVSTTPPPSKPIITIHGDTLISSATQGNQWFLNDTIIKGATDSILIISGQRLGYYYVEVINVANGCGSLSDSTTGINQLAVINDQLSIYPNPFNSNLSVKISSSATDINDWSLNVSDVLGRILYSKLSLHYNNNIDLSGLPEGIYFLTVDSNKNGRAVLRIIKQN